MDFSSLLGFLKIMFVEAKSVTPSDVNGGW